MTAVLYTVRPYEPNDELRYSLRSLANLHDDAEVWVVGHKPSWLTGVHHIPGNKCGRARRANSTHNLLKALDSVPENVLLMDDDNFIMQPGYRPRVQAWGTVAERVAPWPLSNAYAQQCRETLTLLQRMGVQEARWYDLHTPFPVYREYARTALTLAFNGCDKRPLQFRMLYGNLFTPETKEVGRDVKVYPRDTGLDFTSWPLLSTDDKSFKFIVRPHLEAAFPEPSPWETT